MAIQPQRTLFCQLPDGRTGVIEEGYYYNGVPMIKVKVRSLDQLAFEFVGSHAEQAPRHGDRDGSPILLPLVERYWFRDAGR